MNFEVVKDVTYSLMNGETSERFGLMKIKDRFLVNHVSTELTVDEVVGRYKDVFEGLCDLGEYHIEIDPTMRPKHDAPHMVPVALKHELRSKLQIMGKQGIIRRVMEPTDWISSMVAVKKPNKLCIYLDPKQINRTVKIPKFKLPTIGDVSTNLAKAKVFSIVDAKDGFLQERLDKESSKLTTFTTPFVWYCWLQMPFGISSAPEELQRSLEVGRRTLS